jgi:uncharacterized protein (TIGR00661 family)
VDPLRSVCNYSAFLRRRRESLDLIRQLALAERPDLFITDFEPLTALAAASLQTPCYSVVNQHRFCHPLGQDFPLYLRVYSRLAGEFVRRWIKQPNLCIVAVFHRCPPSPHYRHVNALLRERIAHLKPTQEDHVLLYGRGELGRRIAQAASKVPARFVAYGCDGAAAANIEYRPACERRFAADLASCRAVLCTGGQQLISEARYLGKPMLIVPIPYQHEQVINARYAAGEGLGHYCAINRLTPERIERALAQQVRASDRVNGVDQVLDLLRIGNG